VKKIVLFCFCLTFMCGVSWAQDNTLYKQVGLGDCTVSVESGNYYIERTANGDDRIWHSGIADFKLTFVANVSFQHDTSPGCGFSFDNRFTNWSKTEYVIVASSRRSDGSSSIDGKWIIECPFDSDPPVCSLTDKLSNCRISGSSIYCSGTAASISYSFTDAGCGLKSVKRLQNSSYEECSASSVVGINEGDENHTLCFKACDNLGNETDITYTVYFDSEPPEIHVMKNTIPSGGCGLEGETTIGISASDAVSGINNDTFRMIQNGILYYIKTDRSGVLLSTDGSSWESSDEFSFEADTDCYYLTFNHVGEYALSFSIQDNAGNLAQSETEYFRITDHTIHISVGTTGSGAYTADGYFKSMTFFASSADCCKALDSSSWQYSVDGGTSWSSASSSSASVTVDSDGTYNVEFRVMNDIRETFYSDIYPVKIETTAPVMKLWDNYNNRFIEGGWCKAGVDVLISDDNSGINMQSLEIKRGTEKIHGARLDEHTIVCSILNEGCQNVSIKVSDNAGNFSEWIFPVCIDKNAIPAKDISYSGTFSTGTDAYRTLLGTASDGSLDGNIQNISVSVAEQKSGCQAESFDCCLAAGTLTDAQIQNKTYTTAYEWSGNFLSGKNAGTAEINVQNVKEGTYTLLLYVKDEGGMIAVNSKNLIIARSVKKPDSSWFDVSFEGTVLICKTTASIPRGITVCQYTSKAASASGGLPSVIVDSIYTNKSEKTEGLYEAYLAAVDAYGNHTSVDFYVLYNVAEDEASALILAARADDIIININSSKEKNSLKPLIFSDDVSGEKQNIRNVSVYVVNTNSFEYEFITNQAVMWTVYSDWFAEQNSNAQYTTNMSGTISFGGNEEGKIYPLHIEMHTQDNETKSKVIYVRYNKAPLITAADDLFVVNPGHSKNITELVSVSDGDGNIPGDYPLAFIWDPCNGTEALSWTGGDNSGEVLGDGTEKSIRYMQYSEKAQTSNYTGKLTVTDRYGKSSSADIKIRVVNTQQGTLLVNEYWTDAQQLTGMVIVPENIQLTLDGCTVTAGGIMNENKKRYDGGITVEKGGTLFAAGTAASILQSDDSSIKWYGLKIAGTVNGSAIQISNAERGISMLPESLVQLEKVCISDCTAGIHILGGTLKIQDAEITHNKEYGIKCETDSVPAIQNLILKNNGKEYYINGIIKQE
jgi:hypothetical protein